MQHHRQVQGYEDYEDMNEIGTILIADYGTPAARPFVRSVYAQYRDKKSLDEIAQLAIKNLKSPSQWQTVKDCLSHQMTKATFEQWLQPAYARINKAGDVLTIYASESGVAWLSGRLDETISRVVADVVGKPIKVKYEAAK